MTPTLVRSRTALAAALADRSGRRAVVMTMGALHEGHLSLVRTAQALADHVVVTIFVNPLQFGPGEDLARYPRDLDGDLRLLSGAGADVVFAPDVTEMYPGGEPEVRVSAGRLGERLEGEHRPGHFDGVLTVVLKLVHLTAPDVAVFGQKDAQQLMAVRRMVRDLDVPVEVVAAPTVRDPDGVAMSSRNAYLAEGERPAARLLSQALTGAEVAARAGAPAAEVLDVAARQLAGRDDVAVDYVALVDPATAEDVPPDHEGPAVLVVAAHVGSTRLIDNVVLEVVGSRAATAG